MTPFVIWHVSEDEDYKLKLSTSQIVSLEEKLGGTNIIYSIQEGAMPPLGVMLRITHGALQRYHHNIKQADVYDMFDRYVENGGSQQQFAEEVFARLFAVSGFFRKEQAESILGDETPAEGDDE